ncbi:hypothetical protein P153DRAFT_358305 [Dothidotthia symphoricarpi CBS 119687]|uniref:Uncharacterized protein n=1 Tax=Dothidotthia symphoricarpi CBS 119687 TaxID=1392245 RepID=A0A6A6ABF9_9PLEO|nr:uncharacterized protein P153DRAFT_358305 [Dothidotthia symphoricarpi CBS 119687]KAF2128197.1 hypothetical protein P153DRAFT_358305 [Dothidotthia symphoricarpi CBS 119687]
MDLLPAQYELMVEMKPEQAGYQVYATPGEIYIRWEDQRPWYAGKLLEAVLREAAQDWYGTRPPSRVKTRYMFLGQQKQFTAAIAGAKGGRGKKVQETATAAGASEEVASDTHRRSDGNPAHRHETKFWVPSPPNNLAPGPDPEFPHGPRFSHPWTTHDTARGLCQECRTCTSPRTPAPWTPFGSSIGTGVIRLREPGRASCGLSREWGCLAPRPPDVRLRCQGSSLAPACIVDFRGSSTTRHVVKMQERRKGICASAVDAARHFWNVGLSGYRSPRFEVAGLGFYELALGCSGSTSEKQIDPWETTSMSLVPRRLVVNYMISTKPSPPSTCSIPNYTAFKKHLRDNNPHLVNKLCAVKMQDSLICRFQSALPV